VSTFELLESGMQTPMPFNKRESKIDFEDYFVRILPLKDTCLYVPS